MDTLRAMHLFVRAVELGSFSLAAAEAGTTQPTVSKAIVSLEKHLGVRLLERSTTSLDKTEEGTRFYDAAKRLLEEYDHALAEVRGLTEAAKGLVRVNAPVALGQFRLNAFIQGFLAQHPDIQIELILNDRFVDLVEEGVDLAVRLGDTLPPNVVARKVASSPRRLVASPGYLERRGMPTVPRDLEQHDVVRFAWAAAGDVLELNDGKRKQLVRAQSRYVVNNALAIRESIVMGGGIALCPCWLVDDLVQSGALVHVLVNWHGPTQDLHLLYPSRRYQPLRGRLLMEAMSGYISELPGFTRFP